MLSFNLSLVPESVLRLRNLLGPQDVYAVGGIIRDTFLHQNTAGAPITKAAGQDWDLATPLHPKEVITRLRKANITSVPIGIEHGTVAAIIDGVQYEITTFREDMESTDGRHAIVRFSDCIESDLQRRDFTINAFALNLTNGQILDLFNGAGDLQHKRIRTVGIAEERFHEDYLRMLRAARFAAKIDGTIEPETFQAIRKLAYNITRISPERIRDEIVKLLSYPKPSYGFDIMHDTGLLLYILPELEHGYGAWQNRFHADDIAHHILHSVDAVKPEYPFIRFVTLMHDLGKVPSKRYNPDKGDYVFYGHQYTSKRILERIMRRLRFPNKKIETASHIVENHMYGLKPDLSEGATRRFLRRLGRENVDEFLRMRMADRKGNSFNSDAYERGIFNFLRNVRKIDRQESVLKVRDLKISGYDLMEMGLLPGPLFRRILETLLEEVLDNPEKNQQEYLLARTKEFLANADFLHQSPPPQAEEEEEACGEADQF